VELALNVIPIQHQAKPSPASHWDVDATSRQEPVQQREAV